MIYQKYKSAKFGLVSSAIKFDLNYLTVTLLNNSVELSSNLDKICTIKDSDKNSSAHPI